MTERGESLRIYLDANVFIYAAEGSPDVARYLEQLFEICRKRPGIAVTSELTLAEILPKADVSLRRYYLHLIIWSGILDLRAVSRDILIETASYRRVSGATKLADAIHAVTAINSGCCVMLSGDLRIKMPEGIAVIDPDTSNLSHLINELS